MCYANCHSHAIFSSCCTTTSFCLENSFPPVQVIVEVDLIRLRERTWLSVEERTLCRSCLKKLVLIFKAESYHHRKLSLGMRLKVDSIFIITSESNQMLFKLHCQLLQKKKFLLTKSKGSVTTGLFLAASFDTSTYLKTVFNYLSPSPSLPVSLSLYWTESLIVWSKLAWTLLHCPG